MSDADTFDATIRPAQEDVMNPSARTEERVAELYATHREKVYAFLVGQGLPPAKAQDVTQEAFVRLFVALKKGVDIETDHAWLYRVAAKIAVDYWRRDGRSMWVELESDPAMADSLRSKDLTPEASAVHSQRLKRVAVVLAGLPKEQRMVVHLRMQGLRYREIARILKVSIPTVGGLLASAVKRLRGAANE